MTKNPLKPGVLLLLGLVVSLVIPDEWPRWLRWGVAFSLGIITSLALIV
jgi:hypothetical protein